MTAACGSSTTGSLTPSPDAVFYGGSVQVGPPQGHSTVPLTKIDEIKQVAGVKTAFAVYRFDMRTGREEQPGLVSTDSIVAADPTEAAWSSVPTSYAQGHAIDADSSGEVVLGSTIATERSSKLGDTVQLPLNSAGSAGRPFKVVGILSATRTAPDRIAYINITDGQVMLKDALTAGQGGQVDVTAVATGIDVYAKPGTPVADLDRIADQINKQVTGVKAIKPSELIASRKQG